MPMAAIESLCGVNAVFSVPAAMDASEENTVSTNGAQAVISQPAIPGSRYRLGSVTVSYSKAPPAGTALEVLFGNRLVFRLLMTNEGPHFIPFVPPVVGRLGESLEVRSTTGDGNVSTTLNIHAWRFREAVPY